jgi:hypothetical protein
MNADLDRLERLAKAATPGPWELGDGGWGVYVTTADGTEVVSREWTGPQDAAHIAASDPATVLELIAELRKYRQAPGYCWNCHADLDGKP